MALVSLVLAAAVASPAPTLADFRAAPVGQRLAALGHRPVRLVAVAPGEWLVAIRAPEQSVTSNWDDETRLVLYRRGAADFERLQFVSKAGKSVPGDLAEVSVRDLDGDGVSEVVAVGRPHGPVGKATVMVFRREGPGATFYPVFRRRHLAPRLVPEGSGGLVFTYERPAGTLHREAFSWRAGALVARDGQAEPVRWE